MGRVAELGSSFGVYNCVRIRILLIIGASILALGVISAYVALRRPSPRLAIAVGFIGYTNDASGQRLARFAISNGCTFPVLRWGDYWVEEKSRPLRYVGQSLGPTLRRLAPAQSETNAVPVVVTNQAVWRASFAFSRVDLRTRFGMWANGNSVLPDALRGFPGYLSQSDWIEP